MEGLTRFANALNLVQEAWSLYVEVSTADVDVESVANHVEWLSLRMAGWRSSLDQEALRGLVETEQEMLLGCLERLQLRIRNLVATLSNHQKGLQNKDASLAERLVRGVMWTHGERDSAKRMLDAITEEVELADKFFAGRLVNLKKARLLSLPRMVNVSVGALNSCLPDWKVAHDGTTATKIPTTTMTLIKMEVKTQPMDQKLRQPTLALLLLLYPHLHCRRHPPHHRDRCRDQQGHNREFHGRRECFQTHARQ